MKKCPKMLLAEEENEMRTDTDTHAAEIGDADTNFETQVAGDFQTDDEPL